MSIDTGTDRVDDEADATVAAQAEVDHEADAATEAPVEYPKGTVEVPLGDHVIHVLPVDSWRSSAQSALRTGDFDAWAELCLAGNDFDDVWAEVAPPLGGITAMFDVWAERTGQSAGKSRNSLRFSRRTRAR